jgi:hypothetical protein
VDATEAEAVRRRGRRKEGGGRRGREEEEGEDIMSHGLLHGGTGLVDATKAEAVRGGREGRRGRMKLGRGRRGRRPLFVSMAVLALWAVRNESEKWERRTGKREEERERRWNFATCCIVYMSKNKPKKIFYSKYSVGKKQNPGLYSQRKPLENFLPAAPNM